MRMKNQILVFILVFIASISVATTNIGMTALMYGSKSNFSNTPVAQTAVESGVLPLMAKVNTMIIGKMQVRLANFQPKLSEEMAESDTIKVFDAESTVIAWNRADPQLLARLEVESIVLNDQDDANSVESNASKKKNTSNVISKSRLKSDKYILLGWITSIKANEIRQVFPGTTKTSVLYNLDIEVHYQIVDYYTKNVVSSFVAAGHGGIARIVPTNVNHKIDPEIGDNAVDNAIISLRRSVKHGLLTKQELDILPK